MLLLAIRYLLRRRAFGKRGSSILVPGRARGTGRVASTPLSHRTDNRGFHSSLLQRQRRLKTHDDGTGRCQKNGSSGQNLSRGKTNLTGWLVRILADSLSSSKLWSWWNVKKFWSHVHGRCVPSDDVVTHVKDDGDTRDFCGSVKSRKRQNATATHSSHDRDATSPSSNGSEGSRQVSTSPVCVVPHPGTTTAEASGERQNANNVGNGSCLEAKGRRAKEVLATSAIESEAGKSERDGDGGGGGRWGGEGDVWGGGRGEDEKHTRRTLQSALEELSSNQNYRRVFHYEFVPIRYMTFTAWLELCLTYFGRERVRFVK